MRACAAGIVVVIVSVLAALAPVQAGADDEFRAPGAAAASQFVRPVTGSHAGRGPTPRPQPQPGAAVREETREPAGEGTGEPVIAAAPRQSLPPVLPLGTGLACLGLGLGLIGYRLRHS